MDRADKAVLRLGVGLGLSALIAYGLALPAPFVVCVLTVLLLCKPGPPIPFLKGAVMAMVIAALLVAGVLMVPILENYAATGVLLTGALLYAVFFAGARSANPLTIFLVIAITFIPVAGVADQALVTGSARGRWCGARHRSSGQWRLTRFFSGCSAPAKSQRRPPPSVRKRQAGRPCRPRWSSCPSSSWR